MDDDEQNLLNDIMAVSPYNASEKLPLSESLRSANAMLNNLSETGRLDEINQINEELGQEQNEDYDKGARFGPLDGLPIDPLSDGVLSDQPRQPSNSGNIKIEIGDGDKNQ